MESDQCSPISRERGAQMTSRPPYEGGVGGVDRRADRITIVEGTSPHGGDEHIALPLDLDRIGRRPHLFGFTEDGGRLTSDDVDDRVVGHWARMQLVDAAQPTREVPQLARGRVAELVPCAPFPLALGGEAETACEEGLAEDGLDRVGLHCPRDGVHDALGEGLVSLDGAETTLGLYVGKASCEDAQWGAAELHSNADHEVGFGDAAIDPHGMVVDGANLHEVLGGDVVRFDPTVGQEARRYPVAEVACHVDGIPALVQAAGDDDGDVVDTLCRGHLEHTLDDGATDVELHPGTRTFGVEDDDREALRVGHESAEFRTRRGCFDRVVDE